MRFLGDFLFHSKISNLFDYPELSLIYWSSDQPRAAQGGTGMKLTQSAISCCVAKSIVATLDSVSGEQSIENLKVSRSES